MAEPRPAAVVPLGPGRRPQRGLVSAAAAKAQVPLPVRGTRHRSCRCGQRPAASSTIRSGSSQSSGGSAVGAAGIVALPGQTVDAVQPVQPVPTNDPPTGEDGTRDNLGFRHGLQPGPWLLPEATGTASGLWVDTGIAPQ